AVIGYQAGKSIFEPCRRAGLRYNCDVTSLKHQIACGNLLWRDIVTLNLFHCGGIRRGQALLLSANFRDSKEGSQMVNGNIARANGQGSQKCYRHSAYKQVSDNQAVADAPHYVGAEPAQ